MRYEEGSRRFEAFEQALFQCDDPEALEDVSIPDTVAPEAPGITFNEDGTITFPASWTLPVCDRCVVLGWINTVLYEWDGYHAIDIMQAYAEGSMGCPKSTVMAYSWAMVSLQWLVAFDPDITEQKNSDYAEALATASALAPLLTTEERSIARGLAEDVFTIAAMHGAIWV
jgi:hypothetical protein